VNFPDVDNCARGPEDHTQFGVIAPVDARLPGGGGYTLNGLYNVTPAAATRINDNYTTLDTTYAQMTQANNALSLNVSARPHAGMSLQGGFNTSNTHFDSCAIRALLPEIGNSILAPPVSSIRDRRWAPPIPGATPRPAG